MSTAGIIAGAVLTALVLIAAAMPFLNRQRNRSKEAAQQLDTLQVQYDRILTNLKDLDEDYALGKIDATFYQSEREQLLASGVSLLQAMDELRPAPAQAEGTPAFTDANLDDDIEAAIAAKRSRNQQAT